MKSEIIKQLGKSHERCVSAHKDIIAIAQDAIDNFKRESSNKISKQILEDNQNESFNKVIEAFGVDSFGFYINESESQFIEYVVFYKNDTEIFSMDMNSSDFGRGLISDLVLNEEDLLEAYECSFEDSDDVLKIDLAVDKFKEFLTDSVYEEFEQEVRSIMLVFLEYDLFQ